VRTVHEEESKRKKSSHTKVPITAAEERDKKTIENRYFYQKCGTRDTHTQAHTSTQRTKSQERKKEREQKRTESLENSKL
jgi:hypothetical protein